MIPPAVVAAVPLFYLPLFCHSAGGVELLAKQGRIKVVNTLESRLEMMSRQVCRTLSTDMFIRFWAVAVIISFTTFSDDARNKRDIVWGKHTEGIHGLMPCIDCLLSYWTYNYELHWSVDSTKEKSVYCLIAFEYAAFVGKLKMFWSKIWWVCLLFGICFLHWKCFNLLKLVFFVHSYDGEQKRNGFVWVCGSSAWSEKKSQY